MNCTLLLGLLCVTVVSSGVHKRDIFATTGWGSGSTSYSTFYITGKQVKEMKDESRPNSITSSDKDNLPNKASIVKCKDCDQVDKKQTFPQLFSSSGWGPLGR